VEGTERIVRFAFEYARANGRKKVTSVHKANIMKFTDGLWLEVAARSPGLPDIEFEDRIVDNMCMQLVQKPELYDVLVLPNLYGDILSDLCAGLVGGLGVAPGANIGEDGPSFEATHGSAPKYKGQNKVNPTALILSGVLMLRHLGEHARPPTGWSGPSPVIAEGKDVTYDMKPHRDDPPRRHDPTPAPRRPWHCFRTGFWTESKRRRATLGSGTSWTPPKLPTSGWRSTATA
jgi:isocitrate dehydrogenase (NAD+)